MPKRTHTTSNHTHLPSPSSSSSSNPSPGVAPPVKKQRKAKVACGECQGKKRVCVGLVVIKDGGKGKGKAAEVTGEEEDSASVRWTACESCVERGVRCPGPVQHVAPPTKRSGAIISALRQSSTTSHSSLSQRHPHQSIPTLHLSHALQHHLLQAATGELTPSNWFPFIRLGRMTEKFRQRTTRSQILQKTKYENILMASLLALGSRVSTHSAIVGSARPSTSHLGPIRESICQQLGNNVIELVEDAYRELYVEEGAKEGFEVVVALRGVLQAVVPEHPYTQSLIRLAHHQRTSIVKSTDVTERFRLFTKTCLGDSLVALDVSVCAGSGKESTLTATDLRKRYGWHGKKLTRTLERIENWNPLSILNDQHGRRKAPEVIAKEMEDELELLVEDFRVVATFVLRETLDITAGGSGHLEDSPRLDAVFAHLSALRTFIVEHSNVLPPQSTHYPLLCACHTITSARLVSLLSQSNATDTRISQSEENFSESLERMIEALVGHEKFYTTVAGTQSMAMLLGDLDCLLDWPQRVVARVDRGRMFGLLKCLRLSADIYAGAANRHQELCSLMGTSPFEQGEGVARAVVDATLWDMARATEVVSLDKDYKRPPDCLIYRLIGANS